MIKGLSRMRVCELKLFLPRFKFTWGVADLVQSLTALGMKLAFQRAEADFSGINGYEPPHDESLFIDGVFHKAFVEVNEEGTEAAAATAITSLASSMARHTRPPPIPIFRADHPFLFAIRDRKSGAILFLGRMANPSQAT